MSILTKRFFFKKSFLLSDLAILCFLSTLIYGVASLGREGTSHFHRLTEIDLSVWKLPYYTLLSGIRGSVAYFLSLCFSLVVGYAAAHSRSAERWIIPLLDILQSIPVLGFLPGLVLGLVALFPKTNVGLELAAILMIFTGQVWNLVFGFYASLKSIPDDLHEAATVMGLSRWDRLQRLELPYSAVNLAWNSLLSMAGGWFFLIPCEAMVLGDNEYRLPGIGSYMSVAAQQGNYQAMGFAIAAMVLLIVLMDFFIWRPVLAWVQRFRLDVAAGGLQPEALMQIWVRKSKVIRWVKWWVQQLVWKRHSPFSQLKSKRGQGFRARLLPALWRKACAGFLVAGPVNRLLALGVKLRQSRLVARGLLLAGWLLALLLILGLCWGAFHLFQVLRALNFTLWVRLLRDAFWTLVRVSLCLILGTLWAVPVGIWIGTSAKRVHFAQPVIQVLASFPTSMLYPLVLTVLFKVGFNFDWASVILMLLGVQWYILFNVLAGSVSISSELNDVLSLTNASRWDRWTLLYVPSIFPYLVTGWITAAGGAWNASILAEYVSFHGQILKTSGLGATLSLASASGDFTLLTASLTVMVLVVVILNRLLWSRVYHVAQTRFKAGGG